MEENHAIRMFRTTAIVHVIPNPIKIKSDTSCLIMATVCEDIANYYRHLTNQALHIGLVKPSWDAHITISKINPEIPATLDRTVINVEYEPIVRYSGDVPMPNANDDWKSKIGKFWFIDVYSDDIRKIRKSLGLPDYNKFHITIGTLEKSVDVSNRYAYRNESV